MTIPMRAAIAVALLACAGLDGMAHAQSRMARTASTPSEGRAVEAAPSDLAGNHPTDRAGVAISGGVPAMRGITPSRAELIARIFAETGVERISVGALTHSPPALDLALDFD